MNTIPDFGESPCESPLACGAELAASIEIPSTRVFYLCRAAAAYSRLGKKEVSLRIADYVLGVASSIDDLVFRPNAFLNAAVQYARAGAFDRAVEVARSVEDWSWRSHALSLVCSNPSQKGG